MTPLHSLYSPKGFLTHSFLQPAGLPYTQRLSYSAKRFLYRAFSAFITSSFTTTSYFLRSASIHSFSK